MSSVIFNTQMTSFFHCPSKNGNKIRSSQLLKLQQSSCVQINHNQWWCGKYFKFHETSQNAEEKFNPLVNYYPHEIYILEGKTIKTKLLNKKVAQKPYYPLFTLKKYTFWKGKLLKRNSSQKSRAKSFFQQ